MIIGQSPITEQDRATRRAYVAESLATLELEQLTPCPETLSLSERYINGELTVMELGAEIRALNARKFGSVPVSRD
jgi:hypothetical protein